MDFGLIQTMTYFHILMLHIKTQYLIFGLDRDLGFLGTTWQKIFDGLDDKKYMKSYMMQNVWNVIWHKMNDMWWKMPDMLHVTQCVTCYIMQNVWHATWHKMHYMTQNAWCVTWHKMGDMLHDAKCMTCYMRQNARHLHDAI